MDVQAEELSSALVAEELSSALVAEDDTVMVKTDTTPPSETHGRETDHEYIEEDEDRDFLEEGFLENLAVVDSCYSDDDNECGSSPKQDASPISDSLLAELDFLDDVGVKDTAKKSSSITDCNKIEENVSNSRSLKSKENDHKYDKNENVHIRRKASERDARKRPESKDDRSESKRSKDRDHEYRKSSEKHPRVPAVRKPDSVSHRVRSSTDEKRKPSSRDQDSNPHSDRTNSRYQYERSSDRRYDREHYRPETVSKRDKPKSDSITKVVPKIPLETKPVPVKSLKPTDDLVPPGTEDVQLPQPKTEMEVKTEETNLETKIQKTKKLKRTRSQESSEHRKRKRLSPEVMTRDRVQDDQDRMSRELSLERLRARSREKSRERREVLQTSSRLKRELEFVRKRNERINDELERNRMKLREETHMRRKRDALRRQREAESPERFTSRSGTHYSSGRDRSSRHLELSPVSGGRMSRHSEELSFVLSPVSSHEQSRFDYRERGRSFSPISSANSMISMSSEEGKGNRRRRKRSPFWKEMERKLGIKMLCGRSMDTAPMDVQRYPYMQVDETAPPPGTYPMNYPPPGPGHPYPVQMNYDPTLYFPPMDPGLQPPSIPVQNPNLRIPARITGAPKKIDFLFKVWPAQKLKLNSEPPEPPPPPQISGSGSKMSLSSFLEASLKGSEATKSNAEPLLGQSVEEEWRAKVPTGVPATVARCDAAISALRVDNVLNVITSGRFTVRNAAAGSGALYTTMKRFDHPAQESMVKLKSPLLRMSAIKLAYTIPPMKPIEQKKKPVAVAKKTQPAIVAPPVVSIPKPPVVSVPVQPPVVSVPIQPPVVAVSVQPTVLPKPVPPQARSGRTIVNVPLNKNLARVTPPTTSNINQNIAIDKEKTPSIADQESDSDIMFLAEVPKTVNVIATLDLDPIEEEVKAPAEAWSTVVEETSDISEAELMSVMSDISLSDAEVGCAKCCERSRVKTVNASTQYKKYVRTVETQVDLVDNTLQGVVKVQTRRARNRDHAKTNMLALSNQCLDEKDDSVDSLPVESQSTNQLNPNQSVNRNEPPANPIQFQRGSENFKTVSASFQTFSFTKDLPKDLSGVNPLPFSMTGISLNSGKSGTSESVRKPTSGGPFFKQSFQSISNLRQPSIFGGTKTTEPEGPRPLKPTNQQPKLTVPQESARPCLQPSQPPSKQPSQPPPSQQPRFPVSQKSILKPSLPMQSPSLPLFGGSLLLQPSGPPAQLALHGPQAAFASQPYNANKQQPFQNVQTNFPTPNYSYPQSSLANVQPSYPNMQQSFPNVQQTFPNSQQPNSNAQSSFPGNQSAYPGFQNVMYPNSGNFLGPGNNNQNNPVPMMVPPPMNNFGQQDIDQGQRQPFFNPSNQSHPLQTFFPNKY